MEVLEIKKYRWSELYNVSLYCDCTIQKKKLNLILINEKTDTR